MSHEQFVNWLHGYFEIANPKTIGEKETQIIKDHLDTFFKKVTPERSKLPINIVSDPSLKEGEYKITTVEPSEAIKDIMDTLSKGVKYPANHHSGMSCQCFRCKLSFPLDTTVTC